jgi:hypothetical protein
MNDEELEAQFIAEFKALAERTDLIHIALTPIQIWTLIGQVQLAIRHPENTGPSRQTAEHIVRQLAAIVAPSGTLAALVEQGWGQRHDAVKQEKPQRGRPKPARSA